MFGVIEYFSGKLVYKAIRKKFNSDSYAELLAKLLAEVSGTILIVIDWASYQ